MSIISVVYLPEGIVLAADSRLTGRKEYKDDDDNNVIEKFPLSDNAQKVVLLNKCKVGIASCGNAYIDGKTIADYIRLFEINDVDENDTQESVADKLLAHGTEFPGTNFYVCGYSQDVPYVFYINSTTKKRSNVDADGNIKFNVSLGGETEALVKLINADPIMNRNEQLMPLKDGIDFAEFMVDVTIKYQRFSDCIKTCGGDIDVLVMTKDNAFWYKNKLYKPHTNT